MQLLTRNLAPSREVRFDVLDRHAAGFYVPLVPAEIADGGGWQHDTARVLPSFCNRRYSSAGRDRSESRHRTYRRKRCNAVGEARNPACHDPKPPLRSGDDADGPLLNRRVIKKPHSLMRGDRRRADFASNPLNRIFQMPRGRHFPSSWKTG